MFIFVAALDDLLLYNLHIFIYIFFVIPNINNNYLNTHILLLQSELFIMTLYVYYL